MTREEINGNVRLTSQIGIIDKRTGRKHHEVICGLKSEKYFSEEEHFNVTEQSDINN